MITAKTAAKLSDKGTNTKGSERMSIDAKIRAAALCGKRRCYRPFMSDKTRHDLRNLGYKVKYVHNGLHYRWKIAW